MKEEALTLIKKAMLHENEGANYYREQSRQWHEAQVVENFIKLAKEEDLHGLWLKELFEEKKDFGDSKLLSFMKDVRGPELFDWSDVKKINDYKVKDVFKKGMEMEASAFTYYENAKAFTDDFETLHLLDLLITWEKSHYNTLKSVYDAL